MVECFALSFLFWDLYCTNLSYFPLKSDFIDGIFTDRAKKMMEYVFADDTEGHQLTERICSGIDERVSARIGERISPEFAE